MSLAPPSHPSPALPIEVIEHAIGYLRGDCRTLLNVALVHRVLYPHAIQVLYASIRIWSNRSYRALVRLRLDSAAHRNVFAHVEEFTLSIAAARGGGVSDQCSLNTFSLHLAGVLLPCLRHLEFWSFEREGWLNVPPTVIMCLSKTFATVQVLALHRVHFVTLRDCVRLICALPQLRELDLRDILFQSGGGPDSIVITPATGAELGLCTLTMSVFDDMENGALEPIYGWLVRTQCVQKGLLRRLMVSDPYSEYPKLDGTWDVRHSGSIRLNAFLESLGPALQHLDVNIPVPGTSYLSATAAQLCSYPLTINLLLCQNHYSFIAMMV